MPTTPWFVFAGGGTGGHLFPALAVVESLRVCGEPAEVSFFCTQRPIDRDILAKSEVEAVPQVVIPVPAMTKPWLWPGFYLKWRESVRACLRRFRARRPAVVVGAGGYASGPPVHAAIQLGIPAFLLNPDAVPGKANRHMARSGRLAGIFAQWEVTRRHFPAGAPVVVTGCPVRKDFGLRIADFAAGDAARNRALASFGLEPGRRTLLVTGASQGARTINAAIVALAPMIAAAEWQILHLSGVVDQERVRQAYATLAGREPGFRYRVLAFTDQMPEAMSASELIVSRAGASSLAEIQAVGKPSILFPYPYHKDRHQWHNAQVLVDARAAVLIDDAKDAELNARALRPVLESLLNDDARRASMGQAAHRLNRPAAGQVIAQALRQAGISGGSARPRG